MTASSRYLTSMARKHGPAIARSRQLSIEIILGIATAAAIGVAAIGCLGEVGEGEGGPAPTPTTTLPTTDLPCDVETVLSARCWSCHGQTPTPGAPSLTSVAAFTAQSHFDRSQSVAAVAVARMQSATAPMPPPPAAPATADEIAALASWIAADTPAGNGCGPICTSGTTWPWGNEGSPDMNPGMACKGCHSLGEGPVFSVAGTLYPTVHEPDLCNGADASTGAHVVITGADGRSLTLAPNSAGNFFSEMVVALPYRAKVVTAAGERAMTAQQTSGDCNSCHTQVGANGAPGRIMLP
jgi:mono/diheme cytochrome c family protein